MKTLQSFLIFLMLSSLTFSQGENFIFPPDTVYEYNYEATPLDSNNNPVVSEMFFRRDLFFDISDFEGKQAHLFKTKVAPTEDSLDIVPYTDTLYFHFDGTDGYQYFQVDPFLEFLKTLDSMDLDPNFNFVDFFTSLEDWYSVYRFSAALNNEYTLFSVDTTVAGINARVEFFGERYNDELVNTENLGMVNCKKFLNSLRVSIQFINWIPLITIEDTVWVTPGENFWMAKEVVPTIYVDLSGFGEDPFYIYGLATNYPLVVSVDDEIDPIIPTDLVLEQNYPNPFNPSTKISWSVPVGSYQTLKIYDVLGNEITTLVDEYRQAGKQEIEWSAEGLPSGTYFYQLKTESFIVTKKMVLIK